MTFASRALTALLFAASISTATAQPAVKPAAPAVPETQQPPLSSAAERVYEFSKPRILQVRTLLQAAGRQSSLGSGFVVTADGLAITNYHVVSQYALDPKTYRLEYLAPDGTKGILELLAIDVAHDLAVVKVDHPDLPFFQFDPRALSGTLPKGERIYAMGNPLDLGFTIIEGTYNGLVDKSYDEHIHFSGAINPGMSGGPVAGNDFRIVGVNVAKRLDGEQVGFLVPARFAAELIERARKGPALSVDKAREEVGRQLDSWQAAFYETLKGQGFRSGSFGPYRGLESSAPWVTCWGATNADQIPKPRTAINTTRCSSATGIFVSDKILTGRVDLSYSYYKAIDLNAFQFAKELSQRTWNWEGSAAKRLTEQECRDDFVMAGTGSRPALRATWCMRAYREFEGLYNVTLLALTQDRSREALLAQLSMQGVSYANAVALGRRFLEAIEWAQ
ncbi:MAG TPA: serine protease [Usitatibacter sp.]|jgi:S1-C subfamily serine protease|nr:serine protease [Usitatibacter sp.]